MKGRKKLFTLFIIIAVVFSLAACNSKETSSKSNNKTITLTFWNGFTASDGEILKSIVDDFNKTNDKHIKINMDIMPWANFHQKLPTGISSKTAPDFVLMGYTDVFQYVKNGTLRPIDDFWKYDGVDQSNFNESTVNLGKVDGKQYAIPMQAQSMYLYWNKDLFKAAGLDPEKPPQTWEELVNLAPKLTNASKKEYGFAFPKDASELLYDWMLSNGGNLTNKDYTKSTFDSQNNLEVLKTIQSLVLDKKAAPQAISGAEADNLMTSGQLAMYVEGPWLNNGLKKNNINYGIITIPQGSSGRSAIINGVGFEIPISTDDSKIEAIYEFIKYWNTTEIGKEWSMKNGFPPYLNSVIQNEEIKSDPIVSALSRQMEFGQPFMAGSTTLPIINSDVIAPMLEKLFNGEDPAKLIKSTDANINSTLSSNK